MISRELSNSHLPKLILCGRKLLLQLVKAFNFVFTVYPLMVNSSPFNSNIVRPSLNELTVC